MKADKINIIVDADACPRGAMDVLRRLQREFGYRLVTVASFHHDIGPSLNRPGRADRPGVGGNHQEAPPAGPGADPDHPDARDEAGGGSPDREHVTVGDGPDAADFAVVNRTKAGDIVVTQDWGLAALVLAKGAFCLSPGGREYTPDRIEFQLDERHVKAKHRRGGGRTRGPRARTGADDERFEKTLRRLLKG